MKYVNNEFTISLTSLLVLLFVLIIPPSYFLDLNRLEMIDNILVVILFMILFSLTLIKNKLNILLVFSMLFIFWQSFSSYFLADGLLDITNNLRISSLILLINLCIKNFTQSTLNALSIIFSSYIIINFLTIILFPEGLYLDNPRAGQYRPSWFLGIENTFALYLIPGIVMIVLNSWYRFNKISLFTWINIIVVGLTIFRAWSATGIIAYLFVVVSLIIISINKASKAYNIWVMLTGYTLLWFVVVYLNSFSIFRSFITDFLQKDMTFSGRIFIWERVLETIPNSVWYGFGNNTYVVPFRATEFRAHNVILQIILDNGIIGLLLFLLCLLITGMQIQKYRNNRAAILLLVGIFAILIGGLTESYKLNYLFLLFILSYNFYYIYNKKVTPSIKV